MNRLVTRTQAILFSAALTVVGAAACTSEPDDSGDNPDAGGDDGLAGDGDGDAGPQVNLAGSIAITDTMFTNDPAKIPAVSGAIVLMKYFDKDSVTVAPVPGFEDPLSDPCAVTVYHLPGDHAPAAVDEGAIKVSGTANGEFQCSFVAEPAEYVCQSTSEAVRGGTPGNAAGGTLTVGTGSVDGRFSLAGASFVPEMRGMEIELTGFVDGNREVVQGVFPIVDVTDPQTLVLANLPSSSVASAEATYTTFVGRSPIPNAAGFNFLDGGEQDVVIHKDGSATVPEFDLTFNASGEGFSLTGTQPHEFPATATDVTFDCGDQCGAEGGGAQFAVMVVSGQTTDVLAEDDVTMARPQETFATFTCVSLVGNSVTIPEAAVQAILDTHPARIQTTVGRFRESRVEGMTTGTVTSVVVGHSLTGFTTLHAP